MANMSKNPRLYRVTINGNDRLISGQNQAQVARHLVTAYQIAPASALETAELVAAGVKVESACGASSADAV